MCAGRYYMCLVSTPGEQVSITGVQASMNLLLLYT